MYKLVVVGGKLRGQEFVLKAGENTLGRDSSCDIHFPVDGVSKKHLSVTIADDVLTVSDLGSANGTFLNGRIVKKASVKSGDKIGLPNSILQLVYVQDVDEELGRLWYRMTSLGIEVVTLEQAG